MYKIPQFSEQDTDIIKQFLQDHPFATLICTQGDKSVATQVPVLIHEAGGEMYLSCHIMRDTDHCEAITANPEVLVLFQGAHCYISPSWYTAKMGGTWNYQTVHVRGKCRMMSDNETMELLTQLTARFEAPQEHPLYSSSLPADYMPNLVGHIAGLEIEVTDIYPIFKLSQNRDDESYKNIVRQLQATGDAHACTISQEMIKRRPHLFE